MTRVTRWMEIISGAAIHVFPGDVHRVRLRLEVHAPPGPEDLVELQFIQFVPGQVQEFDHLGFVQTPIPIIERIVFHENYREDKKIGAPAEPAPRFDV